MKFLSVLALAASASAAAINARDNGWNQWQASTVTVYSTVTATVTKPASTVYNTVTSYATKTVTTPTTVVSI